MKNRYRSASEAETKTIARSFGATLKKGDVVAIVGDLGAGKTRFVQGVCEAFGVPGRVASPTFVLLHRYEGRGPDGEELLINHFDLYRVRSAEEIYDLGYEEFFFGNGICVVEWADRLETLLPPTRYDVKMDFGKKEDERIIDIKKVHSREAAS